MKWEKFYVICPTWRQETFEPIRDLASRVWKELDEEAIEKIRKTQSAEGAEPALLLIDDCAADYSSNTGRKGGLPGLANNARWLNLSMIVITQNMSSVTPSFRDNCEAVMMFHTLNRKEQKYLFEERNPFRGNLTKMHDVLVEAHGSPHSFLFQIILDDRVVHYKNFEEFLA